MVRYYSLRQHLKEYFDYPVSKICIDAGFTCPNRDGTKGYGGCIYCNEKGSGAPDIQRSLPVAEQIKNGIGRLRRYTPDPAYIVYFQAFTNTYAPVEHLERLYRAALSEKGAAGIAIGTRPDCVSPEILNLIADISKETYLWLEFGVETIHERTLKRVNRGHTFLDVLKAFRAAKERGIRVCLHVIIGLPGESVDDILETARTAGQLMPDGIKIHSLYIEKETQIYDRYLKKPWRLFTLEEYADVAAHFLEYLPETTVVHRLTGEAISTKLYAPEWSRNKQKVIQEINRRLISWNSRQGSRFSVSGEKEPIKMAGNYGI